MSPLWTLDLQAEEVSVTVSGHGGGERAGGQQLVSDTAGGQKLPVIQS